MMLDFIPSQSSTLHKSSPSPGPMNALTPMNTIYGSGKRSVGYPKHIRRMIMHESQHFLDETKKVRNHISRKMKNWTNDIDDIKAKIDVALHRVETANDKVTLNRGSILQMGSDVISLVTRVTNQDRIIKLLLCDENGKIRKRKPSSQRKKKTDEAGTDSLKQGDDKKVTHMRSDNSVPKVHLQRRVTEFDRVVRDRVANWCRDESMDRLYTEESVPPNHQSVPKQYPTTYRIPPCYEVANASYFNGDQDIPPCYEDSHSVFQSQAVTRVDSFTKTNCSVRTNSFVRSKRADFFKRTELSTRSDSFKYADSLCVSNSFKSTSTVRLPLRRKSSMKRKTSTRKKKRPPWRVYAKWKECSDENEEGNSNDNGNDNGNVSENENQNRTESNNENARKDSINEACWSIAKNQPKSYTGLPFVVYSEKSPRSSKASYSSPENNEKHRPEQTLSSNTSPSQESSTSQKPLRKTSSSTRKSSRGSKSTSTSAENGKASFISRTDSFSRRTSRNPKTNSINRIDIVSTSTISRCNSSKKRYKIRRTNSVKRTTKIFTFKPQKVRTKCCELPVKHTAIIPRGDTSTVKNLTAESSIRNSGDEVALPNTEYQKPAFTKTSKAKDLSPSVKRPIANMATTLPNKASYLSQDTDNPIQTMTKTSPSKVIATAPRTENAVDSITSTQPIKAVSSPYKVARTVAASLSSSFKRAVRNKRSLPSCPHDDRAPPPSYADFIESKILNNVRKYINVNSKQRATIRKKIEVALAEKNALVEAAS